MPASHYIRLDVHKKTINCCGCAVERGVRRTSSSAHRSRSSATSLLQTMLIEVAKTALRNRPGLATIYDPEWQKGRANR